MLPVLLLALLTTDSRADRAHRNDARDRRSRFVMATGGGAAPYVDPDRNFLFATQSATGMTAECACTAVTPVKGGTVTITRNLVAWCTKADFSLVQCPVNTPRVMMDKGSPSIAGLLVEGTAATNIVIQNRDLSNAAWTKSNMTCTKTAVGADLVSNAATRCTATSANATVCQTPTIAAARRNSSLYIRRAVGTGVVSVTRDGNYTAITSSLDATLLKRVVSMEEIGCQYGGCIQVDGMTGTGANPSVCVKLATSGDAVDIDLVQDEADYFPSSPITTTAASQARPAESALATVTSFTAKSISWDVRRSGFTNGGAATFALSVYADASNRAVPYDIDGYNLTPGLGGNTCFWQNAGSFQTVSNTAFEPTFGPVPLSCVNNGSTIVSNTNGAATSAVATIAPFAGATSVYLGGGPGGVAGQILISNVCVDASATNCTVGTNRAPRTVAWVGDSIVAGNNAGTTPVTPPSNLQALLGRAVFNKGIPGDNLTQCRTRWTAGVQTRGYVTLIWSCGTNDLITITSAAMWAITLPTIQEANAAGMKVILTTILPKGGAPGWNQTPMQDRLEEYNTLIRNYCVANPTLATCVDAYATFGGQGGDPKVMQLIYDSGDGVHPNAVGSALLATIVNAASP